MTGGLMAPMAKMMARAAGRHMSKVFGYVAIPVLLGLYLQARSCNILCGDGSSL
jgi:hypothetical protein